ACMYLLSSRDGGVTRIFLLVTTWQFHEEVPKYRLYFAGNCPDILWRWNSQRHESAVIAGSFFRSLRYSMAIDLHRGDIIRISSIDSGIMPIIFLATLEGNPSKYRTLNARNSLYFNVRA
ncbi:hypothetical protein PENTCL1PPCAC_7843, partial [Pristionchus entomophagus]